VEAKEFAMSHPADQADQRIWAKQTRNENNSPFKNKTPLFWLLIAVIIQRLIAQ